MKRIEDYKNVCNWDDIGYLEQRVVELIEEGWQPIGGMGVVDYGGSNAQFFQTMVKYGEDNGSECRFEPTFRGREDC